MTERKISPPTRVLLVDDHRLFRESLARLLSGATGISVVGLAEDGEDAVRQTAAMRPDVVLMDIVMPRLDGIHATARIAESQPGVRVVMLAAEHTDELVVESLRAGAVGFIAKDSDTKTLVDSVQRAAQGRTVLDREGQRAAVAAAVGAAESPAIPDGLSRRQFQILKLMSLGFALKQIAGELGMAPKTVRNQASLMYAKLRVGDRAQAILYAMRKGLVT
jgi:DNA-binding NarL/FixJ family response regulator